MRSNSLKSFLLAATVVGVATSQALAGNIVRLIYDGPGGFGTLPGTAVTNLTQDPTYPNGATDMAVQTNGLTSAQNFGDNYGSWIRGYVEAPEDGNYTFFIGSDDASELWFNAGGIDPAGAVKVAEETGCCAPLFAGDRLAERSSDSLALTRGQKYYFSILHKEGGGGDYVDVGWQLPSGTQQAIPFTRVFEFPADYSSLTTAAGPAVPTPTTIRQQPQTVQVTEGAPAMFFVDVQGTQPLTFQWRTNGVNIPGAILSSYDIPVTQLTQNGLLFSVVVSGPNGNVTSDSATLIVDADLVRPVVTTVDHRGNPNGVRVSFSKPVTAASAQNIANYSIDNGALTITSATLLADNKSVQLAGNFNFALGSTHSVRISNISDRTATGNLIDPNPTTRNITYIGGEGVTYNFNTGLPSNMLIFGNAKIVESGSHDGSGYLSVNDGITGQLGAALFTDRLDISRVKFTFKARIGDPSGNPADGFSFNVAQDLPEGTYPQSEEGYNASTTVITGQGLMVAFDNWNSDAADESPSITVKYAGQVRANVRVPKVGNTATVENGIPSIVRGPNWFDVVVELKPDGTVSVIYDGYTIVNNAPSGFTTMQNAQVGFGGRTGDAFESHWFDDVNVNFAGGVVGPVGIATQPANATVGENARATFNVLASGADPYFYQWQVNGTNIAGANASSYQTPPATPAMNGNRYSVIVSNEFSTVTSAEATLTVDTDNVKPTVVSAAPIDDTLATVNVVFSEPVTAASAQNTANYTINGLTVSGAVLQGDNRTVILSTSAHAQGTTYTINISGVQDRAANANTMDATSRTFISWVEAIGGLTRLVFRDTGTGTGDVLNYNTPGTFKSYITSAPFNAVQAPFGSDVKTNSGIVTIFESPRDNVGLNIDQYYAVLYGYIVPPTTGLYTFVMSSDDAGKLFLSTSALPEHAVEIAREPQWNGYRDWNGTARRAGENRSGQIQLTAGQKYYVEAVLQEGGGGDGLEVAWIVPGDTDDIANGEASISGSFLRTLQPGSDLPVQVSRAPAAGAVGLSRTQAISLELRDGNTGNDPVDTSSVVLKVDGATVTPVVNRNGNVTTINYTPASPLPAFKVINVEVSLRYGTPANKNYTNSWSFATELDRAATFVTGTIFIEGEDYNHSGGQYIADANGGVNGLPYDVGAYANLEGIRGIDFNDNNTTVGDGGGPAYRYSPSNDPQNRPSTVDFLGINTNRGSFSVTNNWKVGWTGAGEWMNYTRVFPTTPQTYDVYAYIPSGGSNPNPILHRVTGSTTVSNQTTEVLGQFSGQASGDWGRAVFYKLHANGQPNTPQQVTLGGVNTIRVTINTGAMDLDFLAFVPTTVDPVPDPVITGVTRSGNSIVITWEGSELEGAATVTGPWTTVSSDDSTPTTVPIGSGMQFFRVKSVQ